MVEGEDDGTMSTWKSCCLEMDKHAVFFFSQLAISLIVIVFSITQLIRHENEQLYIGLLSFTVGVYFPQPRMK